jgi:TnpA family transposase
MLFHPQERAMNPWQSAFLGLKQIPRELTAFEIEAFFTFTGAERQAIEQRRRPALKLGLALQIGFLRLSGRVLDAVRIVPAALWKHLGEQFGLAAPDLASLRAMYGRGNTLFEHQQLACEVLDFHWLSEGQRRILSGAIRLELTRTRDSEQLLIFARRWLYEHRLLIMHERAIRSTIAKVRQHFEVSLAKSIRAAVGDAELERWRKALVTPRESGVTQQSWFWAPPAKHSTRQIEELLERIATLYELGIQRHFADVPDDLLRRYARRLANRPPSIGARIKEPLRTIESGYFLRYCLLIGTDRLLLLVRRRVADLWRRASTDGTRVVVHWADMYRELLASLASLASDSTLAESEIRERLQSLVAEHKKRKPPTRAQLVRDQLTLEIRPVRSLLSGLMVLPWDATADHPVLAAVRLLKSLYEQGVRELPADTEIDFGRVWRALLSGTDREQALRALEVATLLALRRALRNGTVWVDHSLAFRSRERLFIPAETWEKERNSYYRRMALPKTGESYLEPLIERAKAGVAAVAKAAEAGELTIDDELHLTPLAAEEEEPDLIKLRAALDHRIGEAQLPDLLLQVDAEVRFSWIMLGREPRSDNELLMAYAGILAHGTSMSAAETARMIPQLSAVTVRQAMRWAGDERRLAQASAAVLAYMRRHPITTLWGRSDLASSDMMSLETRKRVWQARLDPRRQTPSVGIYSHVLAGWGIFNAQPIVLNERQIGAAIDGVLRQEEIDIVQLAVDTHGYTDFGMALSHAPGLDLCPRLKELSDRHLFLPRGSEVPKILEPICDANLDLGQVPKHWDRWVHLSASLYSGHTSAISIMARFGSAARGDPLYEAGVQIGRLLRTIFLADYFTKPAFRRELLRVLNRGEATNALKRLIYTGRVANYQAKSEDEMQAVADALSLLANIVMAWNTAKMQAIFDQSARRRSGAIPPELIARCAPTRTEGLNMRGIFQFPIELYLAQLLPSWVGPKSRFSGA